MIYRDGAKTCPRCRSELAEEKLGLFCIHCGGIWAEELILVERWVQIAPYRPVPRLTPRVDHERRLHCIVCDSPMSKVMFESIGLDRCEEHGIWFDAGELDRVASTAMLEANVAAAPAPAPSAPPVKNPLLIPIRPLIAPELWPAEREEFEIMLNAELKLADLDAKAGDVDDVKTLLQRAILTIDEAIQRWPDDPSLIDRRARLVRKLTAWSRADTPTR